MNALTSIKPGINPDPATGEAPKASTPRKPPGRGNPDCAGCSAAQRPSDPQHRSIRSFLSTNKPLIGHMTQGEFQIQTLAQAEKLATMLASHCPEPEKASIGIWELLSNAIEHGSYEIDCGTKTRLLLEGAYPRELRNRASDPRYCHRVVIVRFRRTPRQIILRIIDEGPGFNPTPFLEGRDALLAPNGRGIALARRVTFSKLEYLGAGNVVEARIALKGPASGR